MPKVSVIIPVYNVEPYLRECLDSVIHQTLGDIEIICIDDKSTDGSLEILREYATRDSRIAVIQAEVNGGLSAARNRGMDAATGTYLYFVDSDDYIVPDALERLYRIAVEQDLDLLRCTFQTVPGDREFEHDIQITNSVCTGPQLFCALQNSAPMGGTAWLHFLKTEFVRRNNIGFTGRLYEDELFFLDVTLSAERSMCINEAVYRYRIRPGSLMTTPKSVKNLKSYTELLEKIIKEHLFGDWDFPTQRALLVNFERLFRSWLLDLRGVELPPDLTGWDPDTVDTYHMLYSWIDSHSRVLENLEVLRGSKVYVYGGGAVAVQLLNALDLYDIPVEGILVTDPSKGKKTALGRRVQGFHETELDVENDVVIVAAGDKFQREIQGELERRGVKRIIPYRYE